jgi:hypothetical protein
VFKVKGVDTAAAIGFVHGFEHDGHETHCQAVVMQSQIVGMEKMSPELNQNLSSALYSILITIKMISIEC